VWVIEGREEKAIFGAADVARGCLKEIQANGDEMCYKNGDSY